MLIQLNILFLLLEFSRGYANPCEFTSLFKAYGANNSGNRYYIPGTFHLYGMKFINWKYSMDPWVSTPSVYRYPLCENNGGCMTLDNFITNLTVINSTRYKCSINQAFNTMLANPNWIYQKPNLNEKIKVYGYDIMNYAYTLLYQVCHGTKPTSSLIIPKCL